MSELDKAKIDFITDHNELRFHAENPIEEDGRIHVTPELLFAVADKIDGLRAELARRDEKIAELEAIISPASFRKFLVEQIKDPELAEAYVKACIQDTTYKELLARRDEIITRLKEDAERLADIADMFGDDAIAVLKHRALMKELE